MVIFTAFSRRSHLIILLVACLFALSTSVFGAEFVIFHTSDIHGAINAHADPTSKENPKPLIGGFAVLQQLINNYRQDKAHAGKRFMYIDSGDFFQGTPIVDRTKGAVMIDYLNRMKVSAVTLGNHEFDYSYPGLVDQMLQAKFPVICCNVFEKATGKIPEFAQPYKMFTHQGRKIGVIGFDTTETASISFEKNVKDLIFAEPAPVVEKLIKQLRRGGADFIILISHLGYEADLKFAAAVEGIDLILGGHSHTLKKEITWAEPYNTAIVHTGSSCEHTNVIHINLENTAEPVLRLESVPLLVTEIGEDPVLKGIEEEYLKDIKIEMRKVIGKTEVNLFRGISGGDSPGGSLIADAMRKFSGADIAFINFGGVRQPFFKGPISVEDAFMVQPFDNFVEVIEMNGDELRDLVERSLSNDTKPIDQDDRDTTLANFNMRGEGTKLVVGPDYGYLLPSGLIITFDPSLPKMSRIVKLVTDKGEEIDGKKIYKVALNDFVAAGGDGFTNLREFKKRNKMELLVRDALINHIKELKVITLRPEKRIFNVRLTEEFLD